MCSIRRLLHRFFFGRAPPWPPPPLRFSQAGEGRGGILALRTRQSESPLRHRDIGIGGDDSGQILLLLDLLGGIRQSRSDAV